MKRDTIKTIAGLIIIGAIVVATFLYGNSQRKAQLAHDQDVKKQQEAKAQAQAKAVTPTPTPVKASAPSTSAAPGAVAGAATAGPATTPTTGGSGLPQAGPETAGMVGMGSISVMLLAVRRSRQALLKAARDNR